MAKFETMRFSSYHDRRMYAMAMAEMIIHKSDSIDFNDLLYNVGNISGLGRKFLKEFLELLEQKGDIELDTNGLIHSKLPKMDLNSSKTGSNSSKMGQNSPKQVLK